MSPTAVTADDNQMWNYHRDTLIRKHVYRQERLSLCGLMVLQDIWRITQTTMFPLIAINCGLGLQAATHPPVQSGTKGSRHFTSIFVPVTSR